MQGDIEEMWRRDEGREEKGDDKRKRRERKKSSYAQIVEGEHKLRCE